MILLIKKYDIFQTVYKEGSWGKRKELLMTRVCIYIPHWKYGFHLFERCKRIHIVAFLVLGQGTKIGLQVSQTSLQISSDKENISAREDPWNSKGNPKWECRVIDI